MTFHGDVIAERRRIIADSCLAAALATTMAALYCAISMRIRKLTELECSDVLQHSELGHLACARHDQPYIVPIHFSFDNQRTCLYAFSAVGQKIEWMRENPRVCIEVEDIADKNHWTTVLIFGVYEELQDTPADASAKKRAQRFFDRRPEWWFPAVAKTDSIEHHAIVIYRVRIDRMTGRQAARPRPHASARKGSA